MPPDTVESIPIPQPIARPLDRRIEFMRQHAAHAEEILRTAIRTNGKEALEELLTVLMNMAAEFQPWPAKRGVNPTANRDLFERYTFLAMKCATALAPYQSPKALIIKEEHGPDPSGEYDLDRLSDDQLLALRQLLIAAKPVIIEASANVGE